MGEGIAAWLEAPTASDAAESSPGFDAAAVEWRVRSYLRALGAQADDEIAVLSRQVLTRVSLRAAVDQLGEPLEAAIEETHLLLDQWLVTELEAEGDGHALSAGRAAVLTGKVPGWSRRWAGLSPKSLAEAIRAAEVRAVPELAPLEMEPSTINLCCHRSGLRLIARLGRLLGIRGKRGEPAGEAS